jgi:hypothetical protein
VRRRRALRFPPRHIVSTITHRSSHRPTPVIAAGRTRYGYRVDPNCAHPGATGCTHHQPLASESKPDEAQPAPGECQSDAIADGAPRPLPLTGPRPPRRDHAACHSAWKIGSDSLSMNFAGGVALISMENQRPASTSAALLTGAERLCRGDGGP